MVTVTLYTRARCHLCDDAHDAIVAVQREHPFALDVVDVDSDPALAALYGLEVPVVMVAGRKTFKYRVDAAVLRDKVTRAEAPEA